MIDLQTHTTASDGSDTPTELFRLAKVAGLSAVGVTDHDTVAGLLEAKVASAETGVELVPGIEISVDYPHGEFHLLGYYVDYRDADFLARLEHLQENRVNRNWLMVRRMREQGLNVTWEDVLRESGGGQVGRPHMARALVRKGYAKSADDAFDRYIGEGKPLHVPKARLSPEAAIRMVREAGGVPILAHPKYLGLAEGATLEGELRRLRERGLQGLECYYSQNTEVETECFLRLAEGLDLVVTAGSDYHGRGKPHVRLGVIHQGRPGSRALLARLRETAGR